MCVCVCVFPGVISLMALNCSAGEPFSLPHSFSPSSSSILYTWSNRLIYRAGPRGNLGIKVLGVLYRQLSLSLSRGVPLNAPNYVITRTEGIRKRLAPFPPCPPVRSSFVSGEDCRGGRRAYENRWASPSGGRAKLREKGTNQIINLRGRACRWQSARSHGTIAAARPAVIAINYALKKPPRGNWIKG